VFAGLHILRHAIIIILAVFQLHSACAAATELDEKLRKEAAETPNAALVFMEIELIDRKGRACGGGITAKLMTSEGKLAYIFTRSGTGLFGNSISFHGGAAVLSAGVYTVAGLECTGSRKFNGRVAQFFLKPGEVVNVGRIALEYELAFLAKSDASLKVRDLSPEAVASLSQRAPNAFSKAKKRYMGLLVGTPAQAKPAPPVNTGKQ
jgi:hypothetical protein